MSRFLRRVWAISAKEVRHVLRDVRTLYLALGMPVVLLLLFGYGVSFDLDRLPIAFVDLDGSASSRASSSSARCSSAQRWAITSVVLPCMSRSRAC